MEGMMGVEIVTECPACGDDELVILGNRPLTFEVKVYNSDAGFHVQPGLKRLPGPGCDRSRCSYFCSVFF